LQKHINEGELTFKFIIVKKLNFGTTKQEKLKAFERLLDIMDDLRTGCPWDNEQTHKRWKVSGI